MILSPVFLIGCLVNLQNNINVGNGLLLCDEFFFHIDIYRINICLTCFCIFQFNQLNFIFWCCIYAIYILMHFLTWLQLFWWALKWYFYSTQRWSWLSNHIKIINVFQPMTSKWNKTLSAYVNQYICYWIL